MEKALPAIPAKRYFTIGEVSDLCGVKPYVLRYWEQEFTQLKPMKRRGNRRYYQHHEVLLIRRIRELLYEQGFTISGARNRLLESASSSRAHPDSGIEEVRDVTMGAVIEDLPIHTAEEPIPVALAQPTPRAELSPTQMRAELLSIRDLLTL
jgi:DNA-binding transcriptional MerR regulator